jgi:hypothetical protein
MSRYQPVLTAAGFPCPNSTIIANPAVQLATHFPPTECKKDYFGNASAELAETAPSRTAKSSQARSALRDTRAISE